MRWGWVTPFFFLFFFIYTHCNAEYYFCVTSDAEGAGAGAGKPICDPWGGSNRRMASGDARESGGMDPMIAGDPPESGGIDSMGAIVRRAIRSSWSRGEFAQMGVSFPCSKLISGRGVSTRFIPS